MNTQTAVEQKAQYPATKPGTGDPSGSGGGTGAGGNGTGDPGTLPVPEQPVVEQKLKSERVQEELKAMAGWAAINQAAIESVQTFATPEIAGLYGGFVIQSAAASGFPVTVSLSGNQVCVTVITQDIDGCLGELTLPVLAFARQL